MTKCACVLGVLSLFVVGCGVPKQRIMIVDGTKADVISKVVLALQDVGAAITSADAEVGLVAAEWTDSAAIKLGHLGPCKATITVLEDGPRVRIRLNVVQRGASILNSNVGEFTDKFFEAAEVRLPGALFEEVTTD